MRFRRSNRTTSVMVASDIHVADLLACAKPALMYAPIVFMDNLTTPCSTSQSLLPAGTLPSSRARQLNAPPYRYRSTRLPPPLKTHTRVFLHNNASQYLQFLPEQGKKSHADPN